MKCLKWLLMLSTHYISTQMQYDRQKVSGHLLYLAFQLRQHNIYQIECIRPIK